MGGSTSKSKVPEQPPTSIKKKIEITSIDRSILDLKNSRDKLQKYRTRLLMEDDKLMIKIKQAKAEGKIPYALQLLKLHHYKQQQYEGCNTQLLNLLQMVQTIDSTQNDIHIIAAMKTGKNTLQQLQNEISIDDIVELMEEIEEQNQTEQEIADVIRQNIPNLLLLDNHGTMVTDESLLAELEQLQQQPPPTKEQDDNEQLLLPSVPSHKLPDVATAASSNTTAAVPEERIAVLG